MIGGQLNDLKEERSAARLWLEAGERHLVEPLDRVGIDRLGRLDRRCAGTFRQHEIWRRLRAGSGAGARLLDLRRRILTLRLTATASGDHGEGD